MKGNADKSSYKVILELTGEQAQQLTRLLDMAKMIDGHSMDYNRRPETMDVIGYRAFLQEMLVLIRDAIAEQQPSLAHGH